MRFPKPLVIVGFILIAAAFCGIIYEAFFKADPQTVQQRAAKKAVAQKIIDKLFDSLKSSLESEKIEVKDSDFAEFKKRHEASYVSKYLLLDAELGTKKYTTEESLKKNEDFNKSSIEHLEKIYLSKYPNKK